MKKHIFILIFSITLGFIYAQDSSEYTNAYVVIADTSNDYYDLRSKMFELSKNSNLEIDTLDRGFDADENKLCLPKDHEDYIYAGFYYPRRDYSMSISIEYLEYYKSGSLSGNGPYALVCAISGNKEQAKIIRDKIVPIFGKTYIMGSRIYIGCMH